MQWLKEQLGNGKYKPALIYTGYYDLVDEITILDGQILEIFDKGKVNIEDVFKFIIEEIKKSPNKKIKAKYPDVFEIFEKNYLDINVEEMLLDLLKSYKEIKPEDIKPLATKIRSIQEAIYKNLNHYFPDKLPNDCFRENGMVEFNKAKSILSGKAKNAFGKFEVDKTKDIQGPDIENLSNTIYWVCGSIIHYEIDRKYIPGKYTIQSLVLALLEQLLWYKTTIDKHFNR